MHFYYVFAALLVTYVAVSLLIALATRERPSISYVPIDILNGCLTVCFAVAAWFLHNTSYVDLERMMDEVEMARISGLSSLFELYTTNPLSVAILMIGYYGDDSRYLQVFGAFVTYGLFFVIIGILKRKLQVDPALTAFGTVVLLSGFSYITATTNIRFWIAINLVLLAITINECYDKRVPASVLAICGVLTHMGSGLLLAVYLVARLFKKKTFYVICAALLGYSSVIATIAPILSGSSIPMISQIGEKVEIYYGLVSWYSNSYDAQMIEAGGRTSPIIMVALACVIFALYLGVRKRLLVRLPDSVDRLILGILCFDVGSYMSYTVFVRFALLSVVIIIPVIFVGLQGYFVPLEGNIADSLGRLNDWQKIARHLIVVCTLVLLFVLIRRWSYLYAYAYLLV